MDVILVTHKLELIMEKNKQSNKKTVSKADFKTTVKNLLKTPHKEHKSIKTTNKKSIKQK